MLLRVGQLPVEALAASCEFHERVLPQVLAQLAAAPSHLVLIFPSADHSHRGWRLAAVQSLAREHAPLRINAVQGDDPEAIAAAECYLSAAEGVTGQLLQLDSAGAGEVIG